MTEIKEVSKRLRKVTENKRIISNTGEYYTLKKKGENYDKNTNDNIGTNDSRDYTHRK